MPRRERREIPWKAVFALLVTACAMGYAWYQYERLHPSPTRRATAAAAERRAKADAAKKAADPKTRLDEAMKAVNLTPEQQKKVEAIAAETTDPARLMRTVARDVLTSEQRELAKQFRATKKEEAAQRNEQQKQRRAKADDRARRMLGGDYEAAKRLNEEMRQRDAARRAAAGLTPAPARSQARNPNAAAPTPAQPPPQ